MKTFLLAAAALFALIPPSGAVENDPLAYAQVPLSRTLVTPPAAPLDVAHRLASAAQAGDLDAVLPFIETRDAVFAPMSDATSERWVERLSEAKSRAGSVDRHDPRQLLRAYDDKSNCCGGPPGGAMVLFATAVKHALAGGTSWGEDPLIPGTICTRAAWIYDNKALEESKIMQLGWPIALRQPLPMRDLPEAAVRKGSGEAEA